MFFFHTGVQEKMGVMNKGTVYALWDYKAQNPDELSFSEGDGITILRRQDDSETEWWWARLEDTEGYVPRNLLGVKTKLIFTLGRLDILSVEGKYFCCLFMLLTVGLKWLLNSLITSENFLILNFLNIVQYETFENRQNKKR